MSDLGGLIETVHFLTGLFGKKRNRLSHRAEAALAHYAADLPLKDGQRAILEWFYRFPKNDPDFRLQRRCNSADALAENLFNQIDLANAYAEDSGADVGTAEKKSAPPAEPEGWQQWLRETYPQAAVPKTYRELPESIRSEFELKGAA